MGGPLENEADKKMRMEASGVRGVQRGGCWALFFEVVVQHYLRLDEVQTEWGEEQAIQRLDVSVVAEEHIVVRKKCLWHRSHLRLSSVGMRAQEEGGMEGGSC